MRCAQLGAGRTGLPRIRVRVRVRGRVRVRVRVRGRVRVRVISRLELKMYR